MSQGAGIAGTNRGARGFTIPMLALFIVVLFAFAALAVDLGVLYTARTSAQHSADAAALAGAFTFITRPDVADKVGVATDAAVTVAAQSKIMGQPVTIAPANVIVDTALRRVTVTVPRTGANGIETFFAKVIGFNSVDVQVRATAEAAKTSTAGYCIKPFYAPIDLTQPGCTGPSIFDPSSQDGLSTYGRSLIGRPIQLWSNVIPSQWGLLALGGTGDAVLRENIASCLNQEIKCGDSFQVEPGRGVGPVTQGVNDLITAGNTVSPDTWGGPPLNSTIGYIDGETGALKDTSRSLVTVVVWNCQGAVPGRGMNVTVAGFAEVFIDGAGHGSGKGGGGSSGAVNAHFIRASACGNSGGSVGGPSSGGTGPFATPVRLIQTPAGD